MSLIRKILRSILEIFLYGIIGVLLVSAFNIFVAIFMLPKPHISEPSIIGNSMFQQDIRNAIALIKNNSPEDYNQLCLYVRTIKLINDNSINATSVWRGIWYSKKAYEKDKKIESNPNYIPTYPIARTLVHETTHLRQFDKKWWITLRFLSSKQEEQEALLAERKFLVNTKTPPAAIEEVAGDYLLKTEWWKKPVYFNPLIRYRLLLKSVLTEVRVNVSENLRSIRSIGQHL